MYKVGATYAAYQTTFKILKIEGHNVRVLHEGMELTLSMTKGWILVHDPSSYTSNIQAKQLLDKEW